MDHLSICAKNAYGIGSLDCRLDLRAKHCVAIYAPNGTFKSSIRKSFAAWSKQTPVKDFFFPERDSSFELLTNPSDSLKRENVLCFQSMADLASARFFDDRLLASPDLKARYISEKENHDRDLNNLLSTLRKEIVNGNGLIKDNEMRGFITGLTGEPLLRRALGNLVDEASQFEEPAFVSRYKLNEILSSSVETALAKPGVKEAFADYARVRAEVMANSLYFGKGFDYLAASSLASEFEKSKFFEAGHNVVLRNRIDGSTKIVTNCDEYRLAIAAEIERADADTLVQEHFKAADEKLGKAQAIKKFKALISDDSEVAAFVGNPESVKLAFLVHAVKVHRADVVDFLESENTYLDHMTSFNKLVNEERSDWDVAIQLFLNRFQLPVVPYVTNRSDVVLGISEPVIAFKYQGVDVDRDALLDNLSDGEKKALYMLSIIFEVERSKSSVGPKLYVFDDVVDSFDYMNKYAFVEYLRDFANTDNSYVLLLTHNFDFFRTVTSRLSEYFGRQSCLVAEKSEVGCVTLEPVNFISKTPLDVWKKNINKDTERIASVAMVRELVKLREGSESDDFSLLSSVLHGRFDGADVTFDDLNDCYISQIGCDSLSGDFRKVRDVLKNVCDQIVLDNRRLSLSEKVVLSIGVRSYIEEYIHSCLANHNLSSISEKTLGKLVGRFKEILPEEYAKQSDCIEQALIIVPENIHINAFMYEPLIDIGSHNLIGLYRISRNLQ